ncbi:MAG: alpha/beta hydrolase [Bacteroidota bacterium]
MHRSILFSCLICLSSFLACAQSDSSVPHRLIKNLAYLPAKGISVDSLQRLNLVLPEVEGKTPLLVWIGGGAWSFVDRHKEMDLAQQFAAKGIAVASVGHRLSSAVWADSSRTEGVQHPTHIQDLAAAFKWLYDQADTYNWDREQIFVGGFSSGAHLAALLSLDGRYLAAHGLGLDAIKGVIPVAGTYDVAHYHAAFANSETRSALADTHVKAVFGETEADFRAASPTTYLENMSVPMLLISENNTYNYTRVLEEALEKASFKDYQVIHVREFGHRDLWQNLSFEPDSPYRQAMLDFILS